MKRVARIALIVFAMIWGVVALSMLFAPSARGESHLMTFYLDAKQTALCKTGNGCDVYHRDHVGLYVLRESVKAYGRGRKEGCANTI